MNERPSMAQDNYFTPDVFSNPLDVLVAWKDALVRVASDPLEASFMTISNDQYGALIWCWQRGQVADDQAEGQELRQIATHHWHSGLQRVRNPWQQVLGHCWRFVRQVDHCSIKNHEPLLLRC